MNNNKIHLASDLSKYFQDQVQQTAHKQGVGVSLHTVEYLGQVLAKFAHSKNYLVRDNQAPGDRIKHHFPTLALMWLESLSNPTVSDQYFQLQHLGDVALFTSGFFRERISRSAVDMDYYMAMGGRAYERVGQIRETIQAERAVNIFFELANSFSDFAEIFAELSDQSLLGNDRDMLRLYEKWLQTGSDRISRMLNEAGVIAAKGNGST